MRRMCLAVGLAVLFAGTGPAARGARPSPFERRCTPSGCALPPSNIPDIPGRHALPAGRTAALGATMALHHRLPAETPLRGVQPPRPPLEIVVGAERLARLEEWLKAVERHEPGVADEHATRLGAWSKDDLQALWADANALLLTMREPWRRLFTLPIAGPEIALRYPLLQLQRLRILACAAAGILTDRACLDLGAEDALDPELLQIARRAAADRMAGEDNHIIRRAALLHTDIATLGLTLVEKASSIRTSTAPEHVRMEVSDGRDVAVHQSAIHWELAQIILDHITPRGSPKPNPGGDEMVRWWYRATAAWMQLHGDHDSQHLAHARRIFPDDSTILFLSGCQRETFASPPIQAPIRTVTLPSGFSFAVGSQHAELRRAETFFRSALSRAPDRAEAHLRLGRVLGLLDRHADAVVQLRTAIDSLTDPPMQYYAQLFVGAEEEALRHDAAAREAYERASALYPRAQSPYLALSQLARRQGDRAAALRAMEQLFALSSDDAVRNDPLWFYHTVQARHADEELDELRSQFLSPGPP